MTYLLSVGPTLGIASVHRLRALRFGGLLTTLRSPHAGPAAARGAHPSGRFGTPPSRLALRRPSYRPPVPPPDLRQRQGHQLCREVASADRNHDVLLAA